MMSPTHGDGLTVAVACAAAAAVPCAIATQHAAAPTADGDWCVSARMPRQPASRAAGLA